MTNVRGTVRDAILKYLGQVRSDASITEIVNSVNAQIGTVPESSIRSYLQLNVPGVFERSKRGRYKIAGISKYNGEQVSQEPLFIEGKCTFYQTSCFDWLEARAPNSVHAIVTDPPYGLIEYSRKEQNKLRNGQGGVWRIPPSYDGHKRNPVPRFTVLGQKELENLDDFFYRLGALFSRVATPGANIVVASNPLVSHRVMYSMSNAGLEPRGQIIRLVMTMRGGDRPKNAHNEFPDVSVMPRSKFEPWLIFRKPIERTIKDNLKKWGTGGFRRPSEDKPFADVIESYPTRSSERQLAPHPSLKPQHFLRQVVRAALPLGQGVIYDPFAGSGSTCAAANFVGYESLATEVDPEYARMSEQAIRALSKYQGCR